MSEEARRRAQEIADSVAEDRNAGYTSDEFTTEDEDEEPPAKKAALAAEAVPPEEPDVQREITLDEAMDGEDPDLLVLEHIIDSTELFVVDEEWEGPVAEKEKVEKEVEYTFTDEELAEMAEVFDYGSVPEESYDIIEDTLQLTEIMGNRVSFYGHAPAVTTSLEGIIESPASLLEPASADPTSSEGIIESLPSSSEPASADSAPADSTPSAHASSSLASASEQETYRCERCAHSFLNETTLKRHREGCVKGNRVVTMAHIRQLRKPNFWPTANDVWDLAIGQRPIDRVPCEGCHKKEKVRFGKKISKTLTTLKMDRGSMLQSDEKLFEVAYCSCEYVAPIVGGKRKSTGSQVKAYPLCTKKGKIKKADTFWSRMKQHIKQEAAIENVEIPMEAVFEAMFRDPEMTGLLPTPRPKFKRIDAKTTLALQEYLGLGQVTMNGLRGFIRTKIGGVLADEHKVRNVLIPPTYRARLVSIIDNFGIIVRTLNSTREVDLPMYKDLCRETSIKILQLGRITPGSDDTWMIMNESMHLVLAHSWEMVEANEGCGLGKLSEEVLEAMQPILRLLRKTRCWQGDFVKNLEQLFTHGQLNGNIELRHIYREVIGIKQKKKRKVVGIRSPSSDYIDKVLDAMLGSKKERTVR